MGDTLATVSGPDELEMTTVLMAPLPDGSTTEHARPVLPDELWSSTFRWASTAALRLAEELSTALQAAARKEQHARWELVPSWKRAFVAEAAPHAPPGVRIVAAAEICRKLEQAPFTLKACGGIESSTNEFGLCIVEDMLRHNQDLSAVPQNPLVHPTWKLDVALQLPLKALKNRWVRRPLVLVGLRATGDCRLVDMSASAEAPSLLLARGDYDADGARAPWAWCDGGQTVSLALDKHLTKMVDDWQ